MHYNSLGGLGTGVRYILAFFRALLTLAGLLVLAGCAYLAFWPVPPDAPTGPAEAEPGPAVPCEARRVPISLTPQTIQVRPGGSIQEAVDQAQPGDTVQVAPGTYRESVLVELPNLALVGQVAGGRRPVLAGEGARENGLVVCAAAFELEGFELRDYTGNGVLVQGTSNVTLRDLIADHTGEYGLFAVKSSKVVIENSIAIGASDTGIYIGQSQDVTVSNNEATENVSGFEIENSSQVVLQDNYAHGNTAGVLVFVLPDLDQKLGLDNLVRGNRIVGNNLPNFASEADIVSRVPPGIGILIMAADRTEVTDNEIRDNRSVGIAVISLKELFSDRLLFDVGTETEGSWIHDNQVEGNGADPDTALTEAGLPGVDLLWGASGWDNAWSERQGTRFPPLLPGANWPEFVQVAYWRALVLLRTYFLK